MVVSPSAAIAGCGSASANGDQCVPPAAAGLFAAVHSTCRCGTNCSPNLSAGIATVTRPLPIFAWSACNLPRDAETSPLTTRRHC